jgi:hypothetical protein
VIYELKTFRLECDAHKCGRDLVVTGTSLDSARLRTEVESHGWKLVKRGNFGPYEVACFHHRGDIE